MFLEEVEMFKCTYFVIYMKVEFVKCLQIFYYKLLFINKI